MTKDAWSAFSAARERYRAYVADLNVSLPELKRIQQELVDGREGPSFVVETPIVYNGALDDIGEVDEIKVILVADNPGRREQAAENRRYLVGPSGKLAEGFFRAHAELGIDFRRNVLVLNKTPIHTPRTAELKKLASLGGERIARAIADSQRVMVGIIRDFSDALARRDGPPPRRGEALPLWIIGYSELGRGKLFRDFAEALTEAYTAERDGAERESVLLFRHFSMNQFSADVRKRAMDGEPIRETLLRVGTEYRLRVLGW